MDLPREQEPGSDPQQESTAPVQSTNEQDEQESDSSAPHRAEAPSGREVALATAGAEQENENAENTEDHSHASSSPSSSPRPRKRSREDSLSLHDGGEDDPSVARMPTAQDDYPSTDETKRSPRHRLLADFPSSDAPRMPATNEYHGVDSGNGDRVEKKKKKKLSPLQAKWEEMFQRLVKYKEEHGDCLVPNRYSRDPSLGAWVSTQRRQYKILTSGTSQSTPMTPERASRLASVGFVWSTRDPRHVAWGVRYKQLIEYKRRHGDCLVPVGYKENPSLSNWVSTQRQEHKLMRDGKSTRLTAERIRSLEAIGFVWEAQRGVPRKRKKNHEEAIYGPDTSGNNRSPMDQRQLHEMYLGSPAGAGNERAMAMPAASASAASYMPSGLGHGSGFPSQTSSDLLRLQQILNKSRLPAPNAAPGLGLNNTGRAATLSDMLSSIVRNQARPDPFGSSSTQGFAAGNRGERAAAPPSHETMLPPQAAAAMLASATRQGVITKEEAVSLANDLDKKATAARRLSGGSLPPSGPLGRVLGPGNDSSWHSWDGQTPQNAPRLSGSDLQQALAASLIQSRIRDNTTAAMENEVASLRRLSAAIGDRGVPPDINAGRALAQLLASPNAQASNPLLAPHVAAAASAAGFPPNEQYDESGRGVRRRSNDSYFQSPQRKRGLPDVEAASPPSPFLPPAAAPKDDEEGVFSDAEEDKEDSESAGGARDSNQS